MLTAILLACLFGLVGPVAAQNASAPPAEDFFENNAFSDAKFSPSGRYLAVRMSKSGRRRFLAVIDLDTRKATVAAEYTDIDIGDFQWVNEERLIYNVADLDDVLDSQNAPGLFAVGRDGNKSIKLASHSFGSSYAPLPWNTFLLPQRGSQDSEYVYVLRSYYNGNGEHSGNKLLRLNTLTGTTSIVPGLNAIASYFLLDAAGEPRLAVANTHRWNRILAREGDTKTWREVYRYESYKDAKNDIEPLGFGPDGTLYVIARAAEDLATLRTLNLATGKLSPEAIVATPGYDFRGELLVSDRLLGVRLTTDARNEIWFDPEMKVLQAAINKALPGTVNLLTVPSRPGTSWVLVHSYSDQQPPLYRLYDTRSRHFELIGATYPKIDAAYMGTQEPIRYKARDGLEIPGLLTLPPGKVRKNLPMVVLVHGGPWVRGSSWGWQPDSQFLATRGYAVLEVEFRGSDGFGARHFEAGFKQWGLSMQDDVADGTRWAIAQGFADPRRICIAGSSYGGYAALMGLIKDPSLYQCAFEWLGVTDIELMYNGTWYSRPDVSEGARRFEMPIMVGDLKKDALQLKETSPIEQASRIRQPLLLAYGSEDSRVPLVHGKKFYSAVSKTNNQVELIVYEGEGHGWSMPKNRIDFWKRVEKFLGKHLGNAVAGQQGVKGVVPEVTNR